MEYASAERNLHAIRYIPNLGTHFSIPNKGLSAYKGTNTDDDSSDEYNSDLEEEFLPRVINKSPGLEDIYRAECWRLGVIACSPFIRLISNDEINISHYNVGPMGCKAIANTMKWNTNTTLLNISDNGISDNGAIALADLLKNNHFIAVLDLSMNFIGKKGIEALSNMLKHNKCLLELSLASNKLNDSCIPPIAKSLRSNSTMRVLDLSSNGISDGSLILANALKANTSLVRINLSGNHMRRAVAGELLTAIKLNVALRSVDLSFNGLDDNVAEQLEELLVTNKTLRELDVSRNRLTEACAQRVAAGLEKNSALKVFNIGFNSLQPEGAKMIIEGLIGSVNSILEELYLDGIEVNEEFENSLSELFEEKLSIYVQFGTRLKGKQHRRRGKEKKDLVSLILDHIEFRGIRMMDFFRRMDKNGSMMLTKEQFTKGLEVAEIPMVKSQVDKLFALLDGERTGFAKYRDFAKVLRDDFHDEFAKKRSNFKWDH